MNYERWENHVRTEDRKKSYCGQELWSHDWVFQNPEHAKLSIQKGNYVQPCKKCMKSINK